MDKVTKYEMIILQIMREYAAIPYANLKANNEIIVDKENHRYQVVTIGWDGYKRIHTSTLHFDIIDGKVWIQQDQTEHGIANDLVEAGVPKSDIVLNYLLPEVREELEFARG
jgi:hypothetical protein